MSAAIGDPNREVDDSWRFALWARDRGLPLVASEVARVAADAAATIPVADRGPTAAALVDVALWSQLRDGGAA